VNHILSLPYATTTPSQLSELRDIRHETEITPSGTVRLSHRTGTVEMRFSSMSHPLPAGTSVYVWWKGGGFVCAPVAEVDAETMETQRIAERVAQARAALANARQERSARIAASQFGQLDDSQETVSVY
jgi:hypothetical protein